MKTVVNSSDGTGTEAALPNGQVVAAKTGTSTEYKDITFCGITPQMAVAVWLGDPANVKTLPARVGAGDVFRTFMSAVLDGQPTEQFPQAADPTYKNFSDPTYHVGGSASSSNTDDEKDDEKKKDAEDKDADKGKDDPAPTPTPRRRPRRRHADAHARSDSYSNPDPTPKPDPDPTPTPTPTPDPGGTTDKPAS